MQSNRSKVFHPLSHPQQRIWYSENIIGSSQLYNIGGYFKIKGNTNNKLLNEAVRLVIKKNDAFRLQIVKKDEEILQYFKESDKVYVDYIDFSQSEEPVSKFDSWSKLQFETPLLKENSDLYYFAVCKISEEDHRVFMLMHHIISDGWSYGLIIKQICDVYTKLSRNESVDDCVENSYIDLIQKEIDYTNTDRFIKDKEFWLKKFCDYSPIKIFEEGKNPQAQRLNFDFGLESSKAIREYILEEKISLNAFFTSILLIYVNKIHQVDNFTVGIPVFNRTNKRERNTMGMNTSTMPFIFSIEGNPTVASIMKKVSSELKGFIAHQKYPYNYLMQDLNMIQKGYENLFQFSVNFYNTSYDINVNDYPIEVVEIFNNNLMYPLQLVIKDWSYMETISLSIDFRVNDTSSEYIQNMFKYMKDIINQILQNPDYTIDQVELLTKEEKHKILIEFNDTISEYPRYKTIHQLFEEQVEKTPDKTALVFYDKSLTYRELNEKANQLARVLRHKGIKPDATVSNEKNSIVAIMVERSFEMIISIMAVLKAGGTCLPIDSEYPPDRIEYMLEDSKPCIILTNSAKINEISYIGEIINVQDEYIYINDNSNLPQVNNSNDLVYIIYTSGSTGKPKGVMLKHKNLVNLIHFQSTKTNINFCSKVLQFTTISFDVSYQEIFTTLLKGGQLYLIDKEKYRNTEKLLKFIDENDIKVVFLPTSYLKFIAGKEYIDKLPGCIEHLITAGEQLIVTEYLMRYIKKNRVHLHNHYGPSEAHVVAAYTISHEDEYKNTPLLPPIGKPITNTHLYIVDKMNQIVPIGAAGELCIAGQCVGSGYLNKPELTSEKFVTNPFAVNKDDFGIMYRTGDLARWLPDGNIEFVGRIDHQVKIRGYRIELGEIENKLLSHSDINETIVIAKEDTNGGKFLCAYIAGTRELTVTELREHLAKDLPDYMIPSYFMQLEKLPLTPNGKIDRKKLPEPDGSMVTGVEYEAPRNITEEKLMALWSEILGIAQIGINDNFFELGGHSLKATSLSAKIYKEFNIEIPLKDIFAAPTIKGLSKHIMSKEMSIYEALKPAEKSLSGCYAASSAQTRIFTLQRFDLEGTNYNMPGIFHVEGELDIQRLNKAFEVLTARHEALRTSFEHIDECLVQRIHEKVNLKIEIYADNMQQEEAVKKFVRAFDLSKAPLLRVGLIKLINDDKEQLDCSVDMQNVSVLPKQQHMLLLDMHHIISDGASVEILTRDLSRAYEGLPLSDLRVQYKDFSYWQKDLFKTEKIKKQELYWINKLGNELPVLNLPTDYKRPSTQSFEGNTVYFEINKELTERLRETANTTGTTLYMLLLAAYNVLLSKYSGQEDIVIGSPIAGRNHSDLDNIIGMFINTLAMRNYPEGKKTFREFLMEVKETALQAYENQDYPFEELIEKLNITRDMSRNPIFDVMFSMHNKDLVKIKLAGTSVTTCKIDNKTSKFDITLTAVEEPEKLNISLEYCTKLFSEETIQSISKHFCNIIQSVSECIDVKLGDIELLTKEERHKILKEFNNTISEYPRHKAIHQLFEEQVEKTPDNTALVFYDKSLTYRELNEKANQLARVLKDKGIQSEGIINVVGLMVEKSLEMVIGILGILKAGGAYLPIDPNYPQHRIDYMLEDSSAHILLTQGSLNKKIERTIEIIELDNQALYTGCANNLVNAYNPNDLAYIMYTSGSTGKPKGVLIEHKSVVRLVKNTNYISFENDDKILQTGAIVFDACTFEIWGALLNGLELYMIDKDKLLDAEELEKVILNNKITILWLTSSLFNRLVQQNADMFLGLRYLLVGGDVLTPININTVKRKFEKLKIVNGYGPTENTTFSVCHLIDKEYDINIPIGKPISNSQAYIVDKYNKLCPIGAAGELCVAGDGLARGYLNRPELTEEKFINNPFVNSEQASERMYRTGDLARWLPDGNIEFLGRIDQQVKIRGFRIELEEIENSLLSHNSIKAAVVLAKDDANGGKYLCAYIVYTDEQDLTLAELREHLAMELPDYMIPSYFVQLDSIPLTPNGKVDKKALPEPDGSMATGIEYEAPRNEAEQKLVQIWSEVLGISKIGISDNFFELGGHSLKATSLSAKIHKELNVEIPLKEIFAAPTIKGMSEYIKSKAASIYESIQIAEKSESNCYDASSAQRRMYTLQQFDLHSTIYNMPGIFEVEGKLDILRLEEAFKKLIERHETLRTSFELRAEGLVQKIHSNAEFRIENIKIDLCSDIVKSAEEAKKVFVRAFDLTKAPLLRVGFAEISPERYLLLFDMHHIISDGVSMTILVEELDNVYRGKELPELKIQYKDFSQWQNKMLGSEIIKKQQGYWIEKLAASGTVPVLNLPTDYQRPSVQSFEGNSISFAINEELTEKLRMLAKETGTTMYMVLLALYNVLLSKYSGQEDIIVGSPIAGRPHGDLHNIIGMFVNTLAIRCFPESSKTFKQLLIEVKDTALGAYENQDCQFEELIQVLNATRDMSRNAIFDVMLSVPNSGLTELEIEGTMLKAIETNSTISKFDLTLTAIEKTDIITINLEYCTRLFKKDTMQRLSGHLINIIKEVVNNRDIKLHEIEILTDKEKQQLLIEFNDTKTNYPKDKPIHKLFEMQADKTPDNIAVAFNDLNLSFRRLNEKANQLARVLISKGLKANDVVGLMVDRSMEMIVAIMGILKAGGAYLPLDFDFPKERIEYMLQDCNVKILLTKSSLQGMVDFSGESILLDDEDLYSGEKDNLDIACSSDQLAYIIYTSGSTGKPKGNLTTHYNIVRVVKETNYIHLTEDDTILQLSNYAFDGSTFDIFGSLLNGCKLILIEKSKILELDKVADLIEGEGITVFFATTALFNALVDIKAQRLKNVRKILFGGERVSFQHAKKALDILGTDKLLHVYGPTESTVYATWYPINTIIEALGTVPIGKPLSNTRIYIVDKYNKLCPIGITGELCISGDGLVIGYLNRPELTSEKFTDNPFVPGERMYRTGDLARWQSDGNIEFMGRIDHQVKIRGFRIELGEIENSLLSHPSIKEASVIAREDAEGGKYLCAYIIDDKQSTAGNQIAVDELREHLAKELPDYMIPAYFVQLDKLPLTSNGKVDERRLPEPDVSLSIGTEYQAPRNEVEEKLAEIWQNILKVEHIGINHSFFMLGGDSIKAIQVCAKLQKYNLKLEVKYLLQNPTIKEVSKHVSYITQIAEQGTITGMVPLTPIQKWFFEKNYTDKHHWNQSLMLYREGGFNEEALTKAFDKILEHHDILRAEYEIKNDRVIQNNKGLEGKLYDLKIIDIKNEENYKDIISVEERKIQGSIDLEHGPIVKLGLFKTKTGDHLLIVIHHLVIDGVSWRIISEDLASAYSQAVKGNKIALPNKTDSFKSWSEKQYSYAKSEKLLKELDYWVDIQRTQVTPLPKENSAEARKIKAVNIISVQLTDDETQKLLKKVNTAYNTEINDILLASIGIAVKEWSGNEKLLINLEGHGRDLEISEVDITRTIGWFTSMYPVILHCGCTELYNQNELRKHIISTKENLRKIPSKGIGYGILKYLAAAEYKENAGFDNQSACFSEAEISFNYLGQFDNDVNTDMFKLSDIQTTNNISSESERSHSLDIVGIVINGRLNVSFQYDKNEYKEAAISDLAQCYKSNLIRIIEHCISKTEPELTPSDITGRKIEIEELELIKDILKETGIEQNQIEDIYPLSPMQEGILFHVLFENNSNMYFEQMTLNINGEINEVLFEQNLNKILEKYDVLRTIFINEGINNPMQVVLKEHSIKVEYIDITELEEAKAKQYIEEYKLRDRQKGFDLSRNVPIRICVLTIEQQRHVVIWSFHHILMDGWCLGLIMKDLFNNYMSQRQGKTITIDRVEPYSKYILWLEQQNKEKALSYWTSYLEDYDQKATLPTAKPLKSAEVYQNKEKILTLNKEITKNLVKLSQRLESTLNNVIQTVWGIVLQRYNNIEDVVFGSVVSGRPAEIKGIEEMAGLFINTIPVRFKANAENTFAEAVKQMQKQAIESGKYEYVSLSQIQANTELKQNLIDNIVAFENYPVEKEIENNIGNSNSNHSVVKFAIESIEMFEQTNYGLNIVIFPGEEMLIKIKYNGALYEEGQIQGVFEHINKVISAVISNPSGKIKEIELITEAERVQLLNKFNDTSAEYPMDKTIQELFEKQAQSTPDNIAAVFENDKLTYKQLNEKANQLGKLLRQKGVRPDSVVGIMVERSLEMIIGIMGILKAGGGYLPIDPEYPTDRIEYMLQDSRAEILLTQKPLFDLVSNNNIEKLNLDDESLYNCDKSNIKIINKASDTAYVIYTSGSTGNPKGVIIEHKALINMCTWYNNYYEISEADKGSKYAGFGFDASVWEIFPMLIAGAAIHIISKDIRLDIEKLNQYYELNKITISFLPTQVCEQFMQRDNNSLRFLLTGGDKLRQYVNTKYKVVNNYGPTESTIVATSFILDKEYDNIPIGRPITNTEIYILDKYNNLQPVGIAGELCISGDGLARGYLNRQELTAEKFADNPFKANTRMYRTGDLARWLPDGNIEFLGRIDHQVKIRGNRIELGEVENSLLSYPEIKEAVVLAKNDDKNDKYLCAYIVADKKFTIAELEKYLSEKLPRYMIPQSFIQLENIPLNANGKINKKELLAFKEQINLGTEYIEARNEIEEYLVDVVTKVVKQDKIGVTDNLFYLGASSLDIMIIAQRIKDKYDIEYNYIFKYPYIEKIAKQVTIKKDDIKTTISKLKESYISSKNVPVSQEINDYLEEAYKSYKDTIEKNYGGLDLSETKNYNNILLAGATGYLGIYLFRDILENTASNVTVIIRGDSLEEAKNRLVKKLEFYFDANIYSKYQNRIQIFNGDLSENMFGLDALQYSSLINTVECIINSAANVKHYGLYEEFYETNVVVTERFLNMCNEGIVKDYYHISTTSVGMGIIENKKVQFFSEYQCDVKQETDNYYVKTKLEAEKRVLEARNKGIKTSIFRMGNLVFNSETGRCQNNINDNAFYQTIKSYIKFRCFPDIAGNNLEFTFIDSASKAVIMLLNRKALENEIFHINSIKAIAYKRFIELSHNTGIKLELMKFEDFLDFLVENYNDLSLKAYIDTFLIHTRLTSSSEQTSFITASDKTAFVLSKLGFNWDEVSDVHISKMLDYGFKIGFFE